MKLWRRAKVASIESAERAAVLALGGDLREQPIMLEHQAARIWQALGEQGRAESEIAETVAEQYGVDAELIRGDISQFLAELANHGIATSS